MDKYVIFLVIYATLLLLSYAIVKPIFKK